MKKNSFFLQWLTLNRLVTAIVLIAIAAMAARHPADHDTWWHLRAGQTMVETGQILTSDPFSFTQAGQTWIDHGWLAQIFWYGLYALGGWPVVGLGLVGVITLAFWLVWQQSDGNIYLKAFVVILAAITSSIIWAARPQIISFLLTAVVALLLHRFKRHNGRLLPWLPLIVLLWVNIHGGYAIAFILLACYLVGEIFNHLTGAKEHPTEIVSWPRWRYLLLTTAISLAMVGINPHTWQMWLYPFRTVGIGILREFIAEWQSPDFHQPILQPFLLLLLLTLATLARTQRRVDWTDLALLGAWTTLSLLAVRNVPLFAVVCSPVIIRYATGALEEQFGPLRLGRTRRLPRPFYLLNWLLLALVILGAGVQLATSLSPRSLRQSEAKAFPYAATQFLLENEPPGPLFNSYNFGGYLIFYLWPDYRVFVDGRTDLYDDEFLRRYLRLSAAAPGWQESLNTQGIRVLFIERNSTLDLTLRQTAGWQLLFEDDQAAIFARE